MLALVTPPLTTHLFRGRSQGGGDSCSLSCMTLASIQCRDGARQVITDQADIFRTTTWGGEREGLIWRTNCVPAMRAGNQLFQNSKRKRCDMAMILNKLGATNGNYPCLYNSVQCRAGGAMLGYDYEIERTCCYQRQLSMPLQRSTVRYLPVERGVRLDPTSSSGRAFQPLQLVK